MRRQLPEFRRLASTQQLLLRVPISLGLGKRCFVVGWA